MALNNKKYEKFYATTGSGSDKITAAKLTEAEAGWDAERSTGCSHYLADPITAPLIFQLQQMQDELDALRTEIALNKSKTTFPGIGTSGSTCLAGNTTTISTSQASAITANTAKTGITIEQGKAITLNTAKTGITTAQTKAITANTAKVSFPACTSNIEKTTATITGFQHLYDAESDLAPNKLKISLQVVSGKTTTNYSTNLTLLKELG
tara:strand:- start:1242 stop:1868 length:627 start_codon:yes stop_codon:yes gene_type:complete